MYSTFIIIFIISVFLIWWLAQIAVRITNSDKLRITLPIVFSFSIMALFLGMREYVGRDFTTYLELYDTVSIDDFGLSERFKIEYNYLLIVSFSRWLGLNASSFFIFSSIIIVALFYNLYKERPEFLPVGILIFFFCYPYAFAINGIRQCIAIFATLNAAVYLDYNYTCKYRFFVFCLWIMFGTLFHSFTILLLPFYWISKCNFLEKLSSYHLYLIVLTGVAINILGLASALIWSSSTLSTYISFFNYFQDNRFVIESGGIGVASLLTIFCYLIIFSRYRHITSDNPSIKIYFLLFAIGICLYYMFPGNMMVERVSYYFLFSEVIVIPAFIKYSCKLSSIYKVLGPLILMWFIFMFFYDLPTFFDGQMQLGASIFNITLL